MGKWKNQFEMDPQKKKASTPACQKKGLLISRKQNSEKQHNQLILV